MNRLRTIASYPSKATIAIFVALIRIYQLTISPWLGNVCRFEPSCSRYMVGALHKYGLVRGTYKGVHRICRCNPWSQGGYDPP